MAGVQAFVTLLSLFNHNDTNIISIIEKLDTVLAKKCVVNFRVAIESDKREVEEISKAEEQKRQRNERSLTAGRRCNDVIGHVHVKMSPRSSLRLR